MSDLEAVNARLRQVVADKDELIASQDTLLGMQRDQLAGKDELIAEQCKLIALVEEQNAELRRRLGVDSTTSSTPPSTDSIGSKAKRRKANSERERSKNRQPGGQKGYRGSGLELSSEVDDTVPVEPAECSTCGEEFNGAGECAGFTPVQQWDISPMTLTKVQFDLMRRRCTAGHPRTAGSEPRKVALGPTGSWIPRTPSATSASARTKRPPRS